MKTSRRLKKLISRLARDWRAGRAIPMFVYRALDRAVDDEVARQRAEGTERRYRRVRLSPRALPDE